MSHTGNRKRTEGEGKAWPRLLHVWLDALHHSVTGSARRNNLWESGIDEPRREQRKEDTRRSPLLQGKAWPRLLHVWLHASWSLAMHILVAGNARRNREAQCKMRAEARDAECGKLQVSCNIHTQ